MEIRIIRNGAPPPTLSCRDCGVSWVSDGRASDVCVACERARDAANPRYQAERAKARIRRDAAKSDIRGDVWMKTGGKCWYCGVQTVPWRTFRVDHVIPVAKGGTNDLGNLVPCCVDCNGIKGNRPVEYLRQRRRGLSFYFENEAL